MKAERYLRSIGIDKHDIVNPWRLSKTLRKIRKNPTYEDYLDYDLMYLKHCNAIYMLPGWKNSRGANIELCEAKRLGIKVMGSYR